ncbi:MAG: HPr family phosphocarrier protein [Deltaproteobacteria bacterium]|jgi:phosphotransferase system HPr (HPr) family protein|nr:HPr family phosphocarrier protein [Deltaproteobacteria bacterium]
MESFDYTITDPSGIHARPAGLFAQKMQEFKSVVTVSREDKSADGKKLIALMKLRPKCGQTIKVTVEGEDEKAAALAAEEFLKANL